MNIEEDEEKQLHTKNILLRFIIIIVLYFLSKN